MRRWRSFCLPRSHRSLISDGGDNTAMSPPKPVQDDLKTIFSYHDATKPQLPRYARGPGGLDWANQPDPFRRYAGATLIKLDHVPPGEQPFYEPVFVEG